ncbi:RNA polymerase II subunit A C-terminal domain phosphatase SSU72-like protein [Leptotrombidium deliense]|uniref:RNA polymerase II subunit A C-terminal domain phosphatase SSU72 n=1 Tax=Leptotrombidium deliense TaxID=299467 RepID=A0A443S448_9ACAR|nr:RNA polymerase II subunit A C-terminal domain phosphatase SSU72-like protein [Leptotrombidium deliense]
MEAHQVLSKKGFNVRSFGSGSMVKLPGPSIDKPNIYDFAVTYEQMYTDLIKKDKTMYTQNGILHMLDRNRRIKAKPERFHHCYDKFDVIFCCEERVYDQVVEGKAFCIFDITKLLNRSPTDNTPVHVINIDVQDNHEEATIGAFLIYELALTMLQCDDLDNEIDEMLQEFEHKTERTLLHTIAFQ